MKTNELTKANITDEVIENCAAIENLLGKEIDNVYNFKIEFDKGFAINPGSVIFQNNYPCSIFRPFTMVNKDYSFDFNKGLLTLKGRDKWERGLRTKTFQLEHVGYKLKTTHLPEGYIWGNPVEINC